MRDFLINWNLSRAVFSDILRKQVVTFIKFWENMNGVTEEWKPKVIWKFAFYHLLLHIALVYGIILIISWRISLLTGLWGELAFLIGLTRWWIKIFHIAFLVYGAGGIGTGIGSHRLFAHKSFKATRALKILLIFCQTFAGIVIYLLENNSQFKEFLLF